MSLPRKSDRPALGYELVLRVLVGLIAAGLYEFDRHVLRFEQGLAVIITVVPVLWWGVIHG